MGRRLVKSFKFAYEGLAEIFGTQRNFRIQIFIGVVVLLAAIFLGLSNIEWAIIWLAIVFVLSSEMINTAIEAVVDLSTKEINPKAKLAKDLSAGAVLVNATGAFLIGIYIFVPHILKFF